MLVMSRKKGETIHMSGGIEISIVDIQGDRVRIGINAPKEVKIFRSELIEAASANLGAGNIAEDRLDKLRQAVLENVEE